MRISDWSSDVCSSDLLKTGASGDATGGGLLDASGDGGGLLGGEDDLVPQIVLVGTSNSDSKGGYNFAGYLEQYMGADVLDVAITGGSFDGSLLHYLPSDLYQKHPPKIIIWAMPWQRSEAHTSELQSLMRMSYAGLCSKKH